MIETATLGEGRPWRYNAREIAADAVVHVLGVLLAVGGIVVLLGFAPAGPDERIAEVVYGVSLVLTLGMSAAYNLWPVSRLKWALRRVDHAMIFGLIAGTYTPFLARLGTPGAKLLLAAIWLIAIAGMAVKLAGTGRRETLSTVLYIALGWSGVLVFGPLVSTLPLASLVLLVVGGVLYSVGTPFHHWRSLQFQNAIWHAFVLAAACCHFWAVLLAAGSAPA